MTETEYFSYFKPPIYIEGKQPEKSVTAKEIHNLIISDDLKQLTELVRMQPDKKSRAKVKTGKLPFATFSGQFHTKKDEALLMQSVYYCIDLDGIGNAEAIRAIILLILSGLKPSLIFVSPSGDGIKIVYRIDPDAGSHLEYFYTIESYIKELTGLQIDSNCKDVSRACFLCHDPEAYYNDNPDILGIEFLTTYKPTAHEPTPEPETIHEPTTESHRTALETLRAMIRNAKDGEKHYILIKAARLAGGYIKAGHITEAEAIECLESEIKKRNIDSFTNAQKTIKDGISFGKADPVNPKVSNTIEISVKEFAFDVFKFERKNDQAYLVGIYRNGIIEKLTELGYCKRYLSNNTYQFIKQDHNILEEVQPTQMKDELLDYLHLNFAEGLKFDYKGITVSVSNEKLIETFLNQSHLIFNEKFLEHLSTHTKPILRDTKTKAFFPFQNTIVSVKRDKITLIPYEELKEFAIWRKHILKRSFELIDTDGCEFEQFIINVSGGREDRFRAIVSAIGYLLHNYNNLTKGQAVIAYDETITDLKQPQGGTGKGIIQQALKQLRQVVKIDGKKFNENDRFCFQELDELTQIAFVDDVKADLGFDRFHSLLTEGINIEKKNKQATYLEPENSPKFYLTSNAIIKGEGSTNERRQFIIEFAPFYSDLLKRKVEPIIYTHGSEFFSNDWNQDEWNRFYNFMLQCCLFYLDSGLQYYAFVGLKQNKLRQYTSEEFCEWIAGRKLETNNEYNLATEYHDFKLTYYGEASDFKQRTFTIWLKQYANSEGLEIKNKRSNNVTTFKLVNKSTGLH